MSSKGGLNWKKGHHRFVPQITKKQKQELMLAWAENDWKSGIARVFLRDKFDISVSEKALYTWKQELRGFWEARELGPEMKVDWNDLAKISKFAQIDVLANELRLEIYRIWEYVQDACINRSPPIADPTGPSYRRIKWWSYMHNYYQDIEIIADRLYIADQYMIREMLSEWSRGEFYRGDLDKWLLLKPWNSRQSMEKYLGLVRNRTILPLEENSIRVSAIPVRNGVNENESIRGDSNKPDEQTIELAREREVRQTSLGAWFEKKTEEQVSEDDNHMNWDSDNVDGQREISAFVSFSGGWIDEDEPKAPEYLAPINEIFKNEDAWKYLLPSQRKNRNIAENLIKILKEYSQ